MKGVEMATFNKIYLLGNLVQDPEMRHTPGGTEVCQFRLAVSKDFVGKDGKENKETLFIDVVSYGKAAVLYSRNLAKGSQVFVEGFLRQQSWVGKDGAKREKMIVQSERVQFLDGRRE